MTARRGTLAGRAAYRLYHRPRAFLRRTLARGVRESVVDERRRRAMVAASFELPPVVPDPAAPVREVCFLTGAKYAHQTAFCAWTLAAHAPDVRISPVIHDDGSLRPAQSANLRRLFPSATVVSAAEADAVVDDRLPRHRYPRLRARREEYPHLKKLTDFHAGRAGWRLVLDSDMLFFRRPDAALDWLASPAGPLHMTDVETAYGYPVPFLSRQCGAPVAERVNVGATGLRSDGIDWGAAERWVGGQIDRHGASYYQEQALAAQLIAVAGPARALDRESYRVMPDESECDAPSAVLHHYVADSKSGYYRHGWRRAVENAPGENAPGGGGGA